MAHRSPCHPHTSAGRATSGAARSAVSDWVAVIRVAARPAAASSSNRSAAAAVSAGFSTAVPAPTSRQNAASSRNPPLAPSAADTASTARAARAAHSLRTRSISGASAVLHGEGGQPAEAAQLAQRRHAAAGGLGDGDEERAVDGEGHQPRGGGQHERPEDPGHRQVPGHRPRLRGRAGRLRAVRRRSAGDAAAPFVSLLTPAPPGTGTARSRRRAELGERERLRGQGGHTGTEEGPRDRAAGLRVHHEGDLLLAAVLQEVVEAAVGERHTGRHDRVGPRRARPPCRPLTGRPSGWCAG